MELSRIIRYIRDGASLSQEKFADKIGVTRLTVTRWENGVSVPNRIAQIKIYEVAKEYGVQFFDFIISDMPEHKIEDRKAILYHASRSGIEGAIRPISREECDFGRGFYMGTQVHQPLTLIFSSLRTLVENAKMYTVELDLRGLKIIDVPVGMDWILLIAYSRGIMKKYAVSKIYEKYRKMLDGYDVAVGKIADDKIFDSLEDFFEGHISIEGVIDCLSVLPLGEQYAALTEKACKHISILEERSFSELERLCIHTVSEQNRDNGIDMTEKILERHRRGGLFIETLLKDGE
jgi:transcriptional regulator with XRE-family HTH domain